jgi:hypothetical protein
MLVRAGWSVAVTRGDGIVSHVRQFAGGRPVSMPEARTIYRGLTMNMNKGVAK